MKTVKSTEDQTEEKSKMNKFVVMQGEKILDHATLDAYLSTIYGGAITPKDQFEGETTYYEKEKGVLVRSYKNVEQNNMGVLYGNIPDKIKNQLPDYKLKLRVA